ncbi:hypothetical protein [Nocardia bovistercoris]|uniref:Uncharacterized protein n=1 Tax=Nocardia bovistercoris TaxID=2785916 RepID=A0A931N6I4_9NOCA|nr:hypothetical protein [Nocardia bovistercoris]MBH0780561.1 hypothetical protein [Nocardia bovistercoris]
MTNHEHDPVNATDATPPAAGGPPRRASGRFLYVALALFGIGLLAIVAIFLTSILSDSEPALWLYLTAMLTPLGFILGVFYALWSGRRAR